MSRPLYESELDRKNETEVATALERAWGCTVRKLKTACELDYSVERDGRVVAVMEIKCRNYSFEKIERFGGLMLSAHKWQAAKRWRETHNIAFILALGLPDGIYRMSIASDPWPTDLDLVTTGRTDRDDPQDIEPCVLIPMDWFVRLQTLSSRQN